MTTVRDGRRGRGPAAPREPQPATSAATTAPQVNTVASMLRRAGPPGPSIAAGAAAAFFPPHPSPQPPAPARRPTPGPERAASQETTPASDGRCHGPCGTARRAPLRARRVSPQWHLRVDSLPPKGAIGWNPSEGDAPVMRSMPASSGRPAHTRTDAAPRPTTKGARQPELLSQRGHTATNSPSALI